MKVHIVGAGIMGLSAAWALARDGHEVAVFEQGPVPNPLGSSVDRHRLIRHPYGARRGYARMVDAAFAAWERLWNDLGERLYVETGILALGGTAEDWDEESARTLAELGRPMRRLSQDELAAAYPLLATERIPHAYFVDTGGALLAGRIVEVLAHHLMGRGVRIHPRTRVAEAEPGSARLRLEDGGTFEADALIVAAGPWVTRLLPALGERVTPSRQVLVYAAPPEDLEAAWAGHPTILGLCPAGGGYLVPPVAGIPLKMGIHRPSLRGDPDRERRAEEGEAEALLDECRERLRDGGRYRLLSAETCFYAMAEAERFRVAPLPGAARSWVMTGFSGHGFKFGPAIGLALAETLAGRRSAEDLRRWAAGEA